MSCIIAGGLCQEGSGTISKEGEPILWGVCLTRSKYRRFSNPARLDLKILKKRAPKLGQPGSPYFPESRPHRIKI